LRIAFIGGSDSTSPQADGIEEEQRVFYPSDIEAMLGRTEKPGVPTAVDILLTFEWSAGIAANDERFSSGGSKSIASLAIKFQPRYHFTSKAHVFFERAPYRNLESAHPTRFISLAPVGNQVKERVSLYCELFII
jgi:hypothetical protein